MSGSSRRPSQGRPNRGRPSRSGSRSAGGDRRGRDRRAPNDRRREPTGGRGRRTDGLGGDHVEGRQAVRELLMAGTRRVREVVMAEGMDDAPIIEEIRELARERRALVSELGPSAFAKRALTESSQGVLALADEVRPADLEALVQGGRDGRPFLLALDSVTDPRNLGAILRTAECAGVDGVILPRHRAAHLTPTATKTAAGAIEYLPIALVGGLAAAVETMRRAGVWVVGLDETGDRPIHDLAVAAEGVCLVAGAEGQGLSRLVRRRCDELTHVPLLGHLDSLNVGAAVAVATYEIRRRRSTRTT